MNYTELKEQYVNLRAQVETVLNDIDKLLESEWAIDILSTSILKDYRGLVFPTKKIITDSDGNVCLECDVLTYDFKNTYKFTYPFAHLICLEEITDEEKQKYSSNYKQEPLYVLISKINL